MCAVLVTASPRLANAQQQPEGQGTNKDKTPSFGDNEAAELLDQMQGSLESYNRRKFLAEFDSSRMPDFPAFQDEIKSLFSRYESFTVSYSLSQSAMENGNGVALVDFGLDAVPNSEDLPDLRRHTQLRVVAAWNGKEWKIVELSPRAIFQ